MLKFVFLAAFLGVQLAAAVDYRTQLTADQDFLLKQKKIYNILYHVSQPLVVNRELLEQGRDYDIEANIDNYEHPNTVKEFMQMYHNGMLGRGEIFSVYYPQQLLEAKALFQLFYNAKNFDVFYKTALWARIYVNEGQFVCALYNAVLRREDTKYIQLPPPYELYPYAFFNSEVLEKAHHAKLFGKLEKKSEGPETYIIPANYSGWYLNREYDAESRLNYFTEDVGLNAYYFYLRQEFPFWLGKETCQFPLYRGEEYLYSHKQLLSRYYLERLSNDIGSIEDFNWEREFYPGYYPTMTFHNGLPFPQRPHWSRFPYYKYKYIKDIRDIESRISGAIDSGVIMDEGGSPSRLFTKNGLARLGNMIEGNEDSDNKHFYGSIDSLGRKILGFNLDEANKHQIVPSALEFFSTSMRDPAFYRLYKRIIGYYERYKNRLPAYTKQEVIYPELKIVSLAYDEIRTYFDHFDTSISNGLMVEDEKQAEDMMLKVRQHRLNHKPFSYHLTMHSDKATKAVIRLFLGPKYDVQGRQIEFNQAMKYFYELDNYVVELQHGENQLTRSSQDFFFVISDPEPSEVYYKKILNAIQGVEELKYYPRVYGFPQRLLFPKGKKEGLPLQMFLHISPLVNEEQYSSRVWGDMVLDNRCYGYPLDRPYPGFHFEGPNMALQDVMIYHKDEIHVAY